MNTEFLKGSKAKVSFEVAPEKLEEALDKAFERVSKTVTIKGFRKGHVTREQFESRFGVEALYEEALEVIFGDVSKEIYNNDKDLANRIVSQMIPSLDGKIERGKPVKGSFTFDVFPDVELPEYKGLEVAKKNLEVTDEDVEAKILESRKQYAKFEEKAEQVIEKNDTANFDFVGTVDGKEFEGGSAQGYEMEIGSGQFIPGFEDQMIGMKKGETKDVKVTFPTPYAAKELEGKEAVFKVTLNSVKQSKLPELNDEFVKTLKKENINTVEELKVSILKELKEAKEKSEHNRQIDELVNKILDNTKVELPESMVKNFVDSYKARYEQQAKAYNIPLETLLQLSGTNKEAFEKTATEVGNRQALFQVVLDKVVRVEKLTPTPDEINAKCDEIAKTTKQKLEDVVKNQGSQIYSEYIYNKFIDLVLSTAKEI